MAKALDGLKPGEVTKEPLQTPLGFVILRLDGITPYTPPPFEQVKDNLKRQAQKKAGEEQLAKIREEANIVPAPGMAPVKPNTQLPQPPAQPQQPRPGAMSRPPKNRRATPPSRRTDVRNRPAGAPAPRVVTGHLARGGGGARKSAPRTIISPAGTRRLRSGAGANPIFSADARVRGASEASVSMRLTTIKLSGFKSFVDPTTLHLPTNMSGIVGPNGCGKSNIIDAIRWVMGESAASRLRGDALTDVIFSGSSGRKPVGSATVELLFDNSDGPIAGEYASYNEISVKRIVSRDGQSQYFLNGVRCRRRDIADLFLGTGLGPRSYSIIEQGMISEIVEARAGAAAQSSRGSGRHLQVQGAPQGNRKPHQGDAREPRPRARRARRSRQAARTPASARRAPPSAGRRYKDEQKKKEAELKALEPSRSAGAPSTRTRPRCARPSSASRSRSPSSVSARRELETGRETHADERRGAEQGAVRGLPRRRRDRARRAADPAPPRNRPSACSAPASETERAHAELAAHIARRFEASRRSEPACSPTPSRRWPRFAAPDEQRGRSRARRRDEARRMAGALGFARRRVLAGDAVGRSRAHAHRLSRPAAAAGRPAPHDARSRARRGEPR